MKEFNKKKFNEDMVESILESNKQFEKDYVNLYDDLYKRFSIELDNCYGLEGKSDFLQGLMDEIIEANHNMKENYNISEQAEKSENKLKGLYRFFEAELQKIFTPNKSNDVLIDFNFKNNFDSVNEKTVYNHFYESLVTKRLLEKSDLETFLILAFDKLQEPKERIKFKTDSSFYSKTRIRNVFAKYYVIHAQRPHRKKELYIDLLRCHFIGFDNKSFSSNFTRTI